MSLVYGDGEDGFVVIADVDFFCSVCVCGYVLESADTVFCVDDEVPFFDV